MENSEWGRGRVRWLADPAHSKLTFKVKHMVISNVTGHFDAFSVEVTAPEASFDGASVKVEIDVASLTTGVETRDNHLRTADFFDVAKFPKISFESDSLVAKSAKTFEMRGKVSIKDVVKEMSVPVEYAGAITDAWGGTRAGFSFQIELDRMELGLNWNAALGAGAAVVGKKVKFNGEIELVKQDQEEKQDFKDSVSAAAITHLSHLPAIEELKKSLADAFVIYESKDQLGGDFYWFEKYRDAATLVLADCVGHGMEGALKAMLGVSLLNQTADENLVRDLKRFSAAVHDAVHQTVRKSHTPNPNLYAMEMGFCTIDFPSRQIQFLGAGITLYILRADGTLESRMPYKDGVGSRTYDPAAPESHTLSLGVGDRCFMASDGFRDQFGGEFGKKNGRKNVELWLKECHNRPFSECEPLLRRRFLDWRGNFEQIDDVTVIGFQPF